MPNDERDTEVADSPPDEACSAYLGEIDRLRRLVIESVEGLEVAVLPVLVQHCLYATKDNVDERVALHELRTIIANLNASGKVTVDDR